VTITSLGHAGFLIETEGDIILCDPWLDPAGAYAASWFPLPSNEAIEAAGLERATILYISHWHRDHLDEWFLNSRSEKFKNEVRVIIPNFKYKILFETIKNCGYRNIEECRSFDTIETASGAKLSIVFDSIPLFVDSALLVSADGKIFLNENDCKLSIADEEEIVRRFGAVDIFAAQFSGATFHPTCYDYDEEKKSAISTSRRRAKFERIVSSIERLNASYYIPSAGPACFLSGDLYHLNLNPATVFSTADDFRDYITSHHPTLLPRVAELHPNEKIILGQHHTEFFRDHTITISQEYLEHYAKRKSNVIADTIERYRLPIGDILADAKDHFRSLYQLHPPLGELANVDLEIQLTGESGGSFWMNTASGEISDLPIARANQQYKLGLDAFWMRAIIARRISWEDFILSFRFSLSRTPDIYNEAIVAFLHLETKEEREDYVAYHSFQNSDVHERIIREYQGTTYELDRYCPHNGEDLTCAEITDGILTCPRHFWQFSIADGNGVNNPASIHCIRI
jgi:UDP-MurNAc hydroxylase